MSVEIIFSHAGGMFPYYLGIAEILQSYDLSEVVFSATSGGCFAPLLLNSKRDIRKTFDKILDSIKNNNKTWEEILHDFLDKELTEEDVALNNRRFCVKLAKLNDFFFPDKVSVDKWDNKADLVDCVTAACYVPLICGKKFYTTYRNQKIVDGFFGGTSSLPITSHNSIKFSVDKWRMIDPSWLIPSTDIPWLKGLFELGVMDAIGHKDEIEKLLKPLKKKEKQNGYHEGDQIPEVN